MRPIRNKLLIALVLFGVTSAAVASAQIDSRTQLGRYPLEPTIKSTLQPGATPNAGEPDVGQGGPSRASLTPYGGTSGRTLTSTQSRVVDSPLAIRLWWAWTMWMARYLNQLP